MIVIEQCVPLMLLEQAEPDALDLRAVRSTVVALRHVHIVAVLVLVVLKERVFRLRLVLQLLVGALSLR